MSGQTSATLESRFGDLRLVSHVTPSGWTVTASMLDAEIPLSAVTEGDMRGHLCILERVWRALCADPS